MKQSLEQPFFDLFAKYTNDPPHIQKSWDELMHHYTQANRHYHNLTHISSMMGLLDNWKESVQDLEVLQFSIFYHDIIYKATSKQNELLSARFAEEVLKSLGLSPNRITSCFHQIIITQKHTPEPKDTFDESLLIDLDLEILSRDREAYQNYCAQIRKEYSVYPGFMYRRGRKKAMQHFLEREWIYQTDWFRTEKEERARENIRKEIESL